MVCVFRWGGIQVKISERAALCLLGCLGGLGLLGCQGVLRPSPWSDAYNPRYPDHQMAREICEAHASDARAFSQCMQDAIVSEDRGAARSRPKLRPY